MIDLWSEVQVQYILFQTDKEFMGL